MMPRILRVQTNTVPERTPIATNNLAWYAALLALTVGCASAGGGTSKVASPLSTPNGSTTRDSEDDAKPATQVAQNTSTAPETSDAPHENQSLAAALPTACASAKECVPPAEFAKLACRGRYPSMAIAMFEKHTPWQRLYLRSETLEAVNAYGDRAVSSPLVFGEEVIVLRGVALPKTGKLQISSSDIDVLRWDGTCATVAREYFSTTRMAEIAQAAIPWRYLEDDFQEALLRSKYVAMAHERHRSACKGTRSAAAEPACQKAVDKLTEAIGVAVRGGMNLPTPVKLPAWATPDQLKQPGTVAMTASDSE
ncbi:MAG TPA: hypothetical protein VKP30_23645 [Polyangiaceae bacterium]|nr:hypothetical protein [Polyangiaceae bacterium]